MSQIKTNFHADARSKEARYSAKIRALFERDVIKDQTRQLNHFLVCGFTFASPSKTVRYHKKLLKIDTGLHCANLISQTRKFVVIFTETFVHCYKFLFVYITFKASPCTLGSVI